MKTVMLKLPITYCHRAAFRKRRTERALHKMTFSDPTFCAGRISAQKPPPVYTHTGLGAKLSACGGKFCGSQFQHLRHG
jgi:hypothetical protein